MTAEPQWYTRHRFDPEPLNKMVELMITNDDFLEKISPLLQDLTIFSNLSGYLKHVIRWIVDFNDSYHSAPKSYIKRLYLEKKGNYDEATQKLIEGYLNTINRQYVQGVYTDINLEYELKQAEKTIQEWALTWNREQEQQARSNNATIQEINEIRNSFVMPTLDGSLSDPLLILQQESKSFDSLSNIAPAMSMKPWLLDGSLNMVYAKRGTCKTWLCLIISIALTRRSAQWVDVGPWKPTTSSGVLYIDGEMPEYELKNRYNLALWKLKDEGQDKTHPECPLNIITNASIANKYRGQQMNFAKKQWRDMLSQYLKQNEQYNILVLDNLSCLFPGLNENDKEAWDPVQQWLLSLRQMNVSVIMVHHAGKTGLQRGTSGREDPLDVVIQLSNVSYQKKPQESREPNTTYVRVNFDKARNCPPDDIKPFIFKIKQRARGKGIEWGYEEFTKEDE